jgi:hypothetical protein
MGAWEIGVRIYRFIWDLDDDPDGTVHHIAEHGVTKEEVEEVILSARRVVASGSTGRPSVGGRTSAGRRLFVVFEFVDRDEVYVVTAYEV